MDKHGFFRKVFVPVDPHRIVAEFEIYHWTEFKEQLPKFDESIFLANSEDIGQEAIVQSHVIATRPITALYPSGSRQSKTKSPYIF